jgi:autotransporter-associated beta strand protein
LAEAIMHRVGSLCSSQAITLSYGTRVRALPRAAVLLASTALASFAFTAPIQAQGINATWSANPGTNAFNDAGHWVGGVVPTGTAFFGASTQTDIAFVGQTTLGGISVAANTGNAQPYHFNTLNGDVTLNGTGFAADAELMFFGVDAGGSLKLTNGASGGNAVLNTAQGGRLIFGGQAGAPISSAAASTIHNGGQLEFRASSSAGNSIISSNGTIRFLEDAIGGMAQISLIDFLGHQGSMDISGLTTSGTTIASIEGEAGTAVFLGGKTLRVGGNDFNTHFAGVIADGGANNNDQGGSLVKQGAGLLTLTGINTYTGATAIEGGTLVVNGALSTQSLVTVHAGATLAGGGNVGSVNVNGGILAPGHADGTGALNINGDLTFNAGDNGAAPTFLVRIANQASTSAHVTGTATLAGDVRARFANDSFVVKEYTILRADTGITGAFNQQVINENLSVLFTTSLKKQGNDVVLSVTANNAGGGGGNGGNSGGTGNGGNNNGNGGGNVGNNSSGGGNAGNGGNNGGSAGNGGATGSGGGAAALAALNVNQLNVGTVIMDAFTANPGIDGTFFNLQAQHLTQVSGESAVGAQQATFDAMNQFMGVMLDPTVAGRGGVTSANDAMASMARKAPAAAFASRWGVWSAGFGGAQSINGDAVIGSNKTTSNIAGGAVGADYYVSPNTMLGFALAGGGTHFHEANGGGNSDLFQAGGYLRHTQGAAFIAAALAYGWQDVTTDRIMSIAGLDDLRARFKTNALSGRIEGGYRIAGVLADWTPYAAGQFASYLLPSYTEQAVSGNGTFALAYNGKDVVTARTELGVKTEKSFAQADSVLTLRSRIGWAHDYNTGRNLQATFVTLPGSASFIVNGAQASADSALTSLSAETAWRNGWAASATFDGQFSDTTTSFAGKGVLRYNF